MITKERLQELIKQRTTIYSSCVSEFYWDRVIDLSKDHFYLEDDMLFSGNTCWAGNEEHWDLEDLFETKEEADWENEFGNITRTETLRLPSWEEFNYGGFTSYLHTTPKYKSFKIGKAHDVDFKNWFVYVRYEEEYSHLFYEPLTKENYTEACRLCKKLFLGN